MRDQHEGVARRGLNLGIAGLSILVAMTVLAGCDNSVEVGSPSFNVPTASGPVITPSGPQVTEPRAIQGVRGVSLRGVGHATVDRGGAESLVITAPENIMPLLTSEVEVGLLVLDWTEETSYSGQAADIRYEVGLQELNEIQLPGVGRIEAAGVNTNRFWVDLSGVGDILASGTADRQDIRISGVGEYHAPDLDSRIASVRITGTGSAEIRVSERIEGFVGFACTLEYWGDPDLQVTGNGTIRRLGP